jgi:AraC-like DNA-binding protein
MDIVNSVIISTILIGSGILVFFKSSMIFDTKESDFEEEVIAIQEEIHINTADNLRKLSPVIIPEDKMKDYTTVLDKVLADEEPFLKKGFVIRDLSELTDIPIHHLSYLINSKYNLHFQDFVNQKRIEYLKLRVHDKEWRNLSLEGLAWAVGFKSRTTFFRAFIKLTGQSPSEYFNNEKQKRADGFTATA